MSGQALRQHGSELPVYATHSTGDATFRVRSVGDHIMLERVYPTRLDVLATFPASTWRILAAGIEKALATIEAKGTG